MDAPLVLTTKLIPSEVDDMAHGLDIPWSYPLELYEEGYSYPNTKLTRYYTSFWRQSYLWLWSNKTSLPGTTSKTYWP